ncbi:MAG: helix-turn-helix transcriptional regulator [Gammaproteobacteria bacterium]|nr:helix-turn-helix transcriptional regulator [Gammaproteobacteria bacterium]
MDPLDAYNGILGLLHRAALDDAHWPAAATLIEEACGAAGSLLVVGEGDRPDVSPHAMRLSYRGEARDDLAREYCEAYHARDEGMPRLGQRPAGRLVHVPDLFTDQERRSSPAYNEGWAARRGENGLITRFDGADGPGVVWSVGNPLGRGGWHAPELRLFEALVPHVRQLVRVRQALAAADALGVGLAGLLDRSGIGVVHLDRGGRVLAANDRARDILRGGDGLRARDGGLHAALPAQDSRLQRLLRRALPGSGDGPAAGCSITIERPVLRSRLALHVHPVDAAQADFGARRAAALVLVVDPRRRAPVDPGRVSALLGLTRSEARAAALLAEGRSVREIAAATGHRESYVRWLLKQAYRKLGVSGQVALVRQVLAAYALPQS